MVQYGGTSPVLRHFMEVELGDALRRGGRVRKPALTKAQRAEDAAVREELACDTGVAGKAGDAVDVAAETLATRESLREPVAPAADVDAVSIGSSDSDSDEVDESDIGAWESVSETAPLACATCGQSEPPVSMTPHVRKVRTTEPSLVWYRCRGWEPKIQLQTLL